MKYLILFLASPLFLTPASAEGLLSERPEDLANNPQIVQCASTYTECLRAASVATVAEGTASTDLTYGSLTKSPEQCTEEYTGCKLTAMGLPPTFGATGATTASSLFGSGIGMPVTATSSSESDGDLMNLLLMLMGSGEEAAPGI